MLIVLFYLDGVKDVEKLQTDVRLSSPPEGRGLSALLITLVHLSDRGAEAITSSTLLPCLQR